MSTIRLLDGSPVDQRVLWDHGANTALVHELLERCHGVGLTQQDIADKLGIHRNTVNNCVRKLRVSGYVEVVPQVKGRWRTTNQYLMPGSEQPPSEASDQVTPLHKNCAANIYLSVEEDVPDIDEEALQQDSLERDIQTTPIPREVVAADAGKPLRGLPLNPRFARGGDDQGDPQGVPRTAMVSCYNGMLLLQHAKFVVDTFVAYVQQWSAPKKDGTPRKISSRRLSRFHATALRLVCDDRRPLAEILDVLDYAFKHQWHLANVLDASCLTDGNDWDRGLTRLTQVRDFYADILADMRKQTEGG